VNRGILWRTLREKDLKERMLKRIEKIYERMEVTIRTNGELIGSFRMCKGVRQGCALSPLFNLYIAEFDEMLKNRNIGEMEIGRERL